MKILALDQASTTGFSIYQDGKLLEHGVKRFGGITVAKAIHMRDWSLSMIEQHNIDLVLLEDIQLQESPTTFKTLAYLQCGIAVGLREAGIEYKLVSPSTWRRKNGIKGRKRAEKKKNAIALVQQLYNIKVSNDAAEAILLGRSYYLSA